MTDEQRALVRGIRANPLDDAPWLIYSDWLEEHDQHGLALSLREHVATRSKNTGCLAFMFSCGELWPTLDELARWGCPQCKEWAYQRLGESTWLSLYEENDGQGAVLDRRFGNWLPRLV